MEIYYIVWKRHKETPEQANGDYYRLELSTEISQVKKSYPGELSKNFFYPNSTVVQPYLSYMAMKFVKMVWVCRNQVF